ncbi:MAG: PDDEXK nuclease domain-containing protein [Oscillospiraceae bacterium]|nr:PDDEXK nuclease domain-containing protein [Oscillospiraceae bacterium]
MDIANSGQVLFDEISSLIDQTRHAIYANANKATILLFWNIGCRIRKDILHSKRANYGKQIVSALATQLTQRYGQSFESRNLRRMMQFSEQFLDYEIVSALPTQLSWSHYVEILPLKTMDAKIYYLNEAATTMIGAKAMRKLISRRSYERKEIANAQIRPGATLPPNTFKDPYLFDVLGLKDDFNEEDLEAAILNELEKIFLEFGNGFSYVGKQKRMIIDGEDHHLDLLFYSRPLKRLIAVELKLGRFQAQHKGQMELYLGWLDQYERQEDENAPIGLILCAETSREKIELMNLDRDGIMVAEYWTMLPPKEVFEQKIRDLLIEARERLARRKDLNGTKNQRQIETHLLLTDDEE